MHVTSLLLKNEQLECIEVCALRTHVTSLLLKIKLAYNALIRIGQWMQLWLDISQS